MEFSLKKYQDNKTIELLKKNSFLLFSINANQNAKNWLVIEQNLSKLEITYHKSYNNSAMKIFRKSTLKNLENLIGSTFFFLKPKKVKQTMIRSNTINSLSSTQFTILVFKLNNKMHSIPQIKTLNTFNYKKNAQIMYQFFSTTLKKPVQIGSLTNYSRQCDSNT